MQSLRVFRPLNLLILIALQTLCFNYLDFTTNSFRITIELLLLIGATVLITSAGYLYNDWEDVQADTINKPNKMPILKWSPWVFYVVFFGFNGLAIWLVQGLNPLLTKYFLGIIVLLIAYSRFLKRLPLIGNLTISVLAAFSVYVVYLHFQSQNRNLIVFYAGFAALLTYVREIIKDLQDVEGDKQAGYITFPVLAGMKQARSVVILTSMFILLVYGNLLWTWIIPMFRMPMRSVFIIYQAVCVLLPLIYLIWKSTKATTSKEFGSLSSLAKYIMATGILSMMLF